MADSEKGEEGGSAKINVTVDLEALFTGTDYDESIASIVKAEFTEAVRKAAKAEIRLHETQIVRLVKKQVQQGSIAELKRLLGGET